MARRVITLGNSDFTAACRSLAASVYASGFRPDAVLEIARGGVYVGQEMFGSVFHGSTRLQRPGTRAKSHGAGRLIAMLPRPVADMLRRAESWVLSLRKPRPADHTYVRLPEFPPGTRRILIVDDAVDSGVTLDAVVRAVGAALPDAEVRSAVITVTTRRPLVRPDYTLYNDLSLVRFPWSPDN